MSKFNTLFNQTTYQINRQKSGGQFRTSRTVTQHLDRFPRAGKLFSGQLLRKQLSCTPTEKKENKKISHFSFSKISLSHRHLAHLPLPHFIFNGTAKAKEPNCSYAAIKLFTILLLFGISPFNETFGQTIKDSTSISKNTVYFELLGNGGTYSLNYDRILFKKNLLKISTSIGLSYLYPYVNRTHFISNPLELNFFYGKKHDIELSIGYSFLFFILKRDGFLSKFRFG